MSKNKKPNNGECTNAQLISTLNKLAQKMDQLPNRADLQSVETELTRKLYLTTQNFDRKIQDNAREMRGISQQLEKQAATMHKLEREVENQKRNVPTSIAHQKRNEAK